MSILKRTELIRALKAPLEKKIDQHAVESWAAAFWQLPRPKPAAARANETPPFVMMFPPPNITGNLHLGHALTAALQDALVRQRRMMGVETVWTLGFDHAGLATQSIVEKLLFNQKGLTRQEYGRDKFIELVNQWKENKRCEMRTQLNRLGLCLNFEREYFTMDDNSSLAVQVAFKKLFEKGTIYRSEKLVHWSEKLQTTLSDIEVEIKGDVNYYSRTGEVVKRRPVSQWFIDTSKMTQDAIQVVQNSSIEMIPKNYKNSWYQWLTEKNAEDWCISRQSWWGHRIPAYKLKSTPDESGSWVIADCLEEAKEKLGCQSIDDIMQDPDVLDTWFSSSLLPLTVSGWPNVDKFQHAKTSASFPLTIMETGFDILNFWVSKMVMICMALENEVPFKLILLHGMICDSEGKKMSKSKGNVIDPLHIIDGASLKDLQNSSMEVQTSGSLDPVLIQKQKKLFPNGIPKCGADVLRAYLLSYDIQEEIVPIQVSQIDKIRRLTNKIWNVYRFVLNVMGYYNCETLLQCDLQHLDLTNLKPVDKEVLKKLAHCVEISHHSFQVDYQLQKSFYQVENFLVVDLSTNYLAEIKAILLNPEADAEERKLKIQVLITCLNTVAKLVHPFMPHLTEFLYQKMKLTMGDDESFVLEQSLGDSSYPSLDEWQRVQ